MIDEMHLGFITMHCLHHGQERHLTAEWMAEELQEHGYSYDDEEVEHGLRNLVAKGLMETDEQEFWTTEEGAQYLEELGALASELGDEVL